jgi:uncharacterized protein
MTDTTTATMIAPPPLCSVRPLRFVLAGGSGQVGTIVARHWHAQGHSVTVLSRSGAIAPWQVVSWDGLNLDDWTERLDGADVLLNLCGRSVNCRYGRANRREILQSRTESTRVLGEAIRTLAIPPRLWMNASTATIYRHSFDRAMDEATGEIGGNEPVAPSTWRFSIDVATQWERAFVAVDTPHTRKIALRSAMVMSPSRGGPFDQLLRLVRFGLGGPAGSGQQYVSWIHHVDFVRALEFLIAREEIDGPVNVASPSPLPNRDFMHAIRKAWGSSFGLPAREWMLKIGAFFLRTETELILKSRRVVPGRLLENGFRFQYPTWEQAGRDLVRSWPLANAKK